MKPETLLQKIIYGTLSNVIVVILAIMFLHALTVTG